MTAEKTIGLFEKLSPRTYVYIIYAPKWFKKSFWTVAISGYFKSLAWNSDGTLHGVLLEDRKVDVIHYKGIIEVHERKSEKAPKRAKRNEKP